VLSIVIRTLNEEQWIGPLLQALRAQTLQNVEIIVVDSGSIDRTREIAAELSDKVLDIQGDSFSYGYALNHGIDRATGDLVAIVSAHTLPMHQNWLENLSTPFASDIQGSNLALTYGKQRGNHLSKLSEDMDFRRQFPDQPRRQHGRDYFCNNANSLIRRDLWLQHPFDESLPGLEDLAWAKHWLEQGLEIAYVPSAGIFHIHEESWAQVHRRFRREATAAKMSHIELARPAAIIANELRAFAADLVEVAKSGASPAAGVEAAKYRYWKTRGTLDGSRVTVPLALMPMVDSTDGYDALEIQGVNQARMVRRRFSVLRPNEVLIRISYVGICQTDLEVLRSTLGYYKEGRATLPLVPGHEYSGVIEKVGANVETLRVGDGVVGECILSCGTCPNCLANRQTACRQRREVGVVNYNGACAEYLTLPARFVHKLPTDVSLLSACTVEPLAVVLKGFRRVALNHAREIGRRRVLVVGAGAIGNLCAQVASHYDHRVTIVDRIPERLVPLESVCDAVLFQLPNTVDQFEYIVECTGAAQVAEELIRRAATGSNILFLGFPYAAVSWDIEQLVAHDKRFVGSVGSDYEAFEAGIQLLHSLNLDQFNATILSLQDWESAYRLHETKRTLKVKLAVHPIHRATPT
jgi:threonine dehydrogenase-like Zn-dependent dehydrogenase/glycosyltransferase involved in cell wall biosynthesis